MLVFRIYWLLICTGQLKLEMGDQSNRFFNLAAQHPELGEKFEEILNQQHTSPPIPEWEFIKK